MPLSYLPETPSQTAGPFLHIGLMPRVAGLAPFDTELGRVIAGPDCPGERIVVSGVVRDGLAAPVTDMLIEIWQADPAGVYAHPLARSGADVAADFHGFGRVATDLEDGTFRIETVKPGAVPGRHGHRQAPHLNLYLLARGVNVGLHTRVYFEDEANDDDPVLRMVEQPVRRETLIATAQGDGHYSFDIRLQGEAETVFFDV